MTRFAPATCHCVLNIPDNPYNESRAEFIQQCRTHDRPSECFAHNRSLNTSTENQRTAIKRKPEFSRR